VKTCHWHQILSAITTMCTNQRVTIVQATIRSLCSSKTIHLLKKSSVKSPSTKSNTERLTRTLLKKESKQLQMQPLSMGNHNTITLEVVTNLAMLMQDNSKTLITLMLSHCTTKTCKSKDKRDLRFWKINHCKRALSFCTSFLKILQKIAALSRMLIWSD